MKKNLPVTLRISHSTHSEATRLAKEMDIPTSQVLKWCVESSLKIIMDKRTNPPLPKTIEILKKFNS
tara:strand:+ start:964 stop:1164 length:201 start_codon:yes stop_codon:yes gene_type:complete